MEGQIRVHSRTASLVVVLALAAACCSRRELDLDSARIGVDAGGGDAVTDRAPADGGGAGDGGLQPFDAIGLPPIDAQESECVTAAIALPWTKPASPITQLDVAAGANAIAVMNRQPSTLDVRTYTRDGAVIAGYQFAADAQFLSYRDGRFLLVARGVTGDFVATAIAPDLVAGTRLYSAAASATERMLGAIALATTTIVITDEHFVNVGAARAVTWSAALGAADGGAFRTGRVYGVAAQADRVLIAWGAENRLRLAVLDTAGALIARDDEDDFLGNLGSETATAIAWDTGLLLFEGNEVRLTQIGFDLSRKVLGTNEQLPTFYRSAPRVAAIGLQGRPVAFWLTVFPGTDNSQGSTIHQLYGCELDLAAPSTCLAAPPIAATGFGGYGIAQEPVAAAAIPGTAAFAVAHTDVTGRSWLRIADLGCASRPAAP